MTPELRQRIDRLALFNPSRPYSNYYAPFWELVKKVSILADTYPGLEEALDATLWLLEQNDERNPPARSEYL
jgi:hypothetical protein